MNEFNQLMFGEFSKDPLDMNNRSMPAFSDELVVRKARIFRLL
jgi:hypothetical protein